MDSTGPIVWANRQDLTLPVSFSDPGISNHTYINGDGEISLGHCEQ